MRGKNNMKKRIFTWLLAVCMAASILAVPAGAAGTVTFSDVWDRDTAVAVEALRLMGVLDGYGDGSFRPDAQLTRAQFCKMAVYAMNGEDQLGLYSTVTVFPDVKPSHWASSYINMAARKGIISGYPDGSFHPERTVTIGQAVTILLRLLEYKDENVGGVWPDSYMAVGASIGLTDGIAGSGNAPLTRGQAAKLFLNLLRADKKDGGRYVEGLNNCRTVPNAMLVSSTADGPDGRGTAMEMADGSVYSLRGGKVSNGLLNGQKGTLLLTKEGSRVITFIPDSLGSSKTVTLATAKVTQLTDSNGTIYAMTSEIPVSGGQGGTWGSACSWLTAGTALTLYLNDAGEVEYVLVGGGTASSNAAVIVYSKGSAAGFESLTNGISTYSIYKNGAPAVAADLRPYDVATYSGASNSIRVCDTRITVYYESCYPNPSEPSKITALGHEFQVLPTAMESLSRFRPGDQMTLLLTEDNQVAGAVAASGTTATGNALGIAKSDSSVELLCGITVSGTSSQTGMSGKLVRVSSSKAGSISMVPVSGGVSGDLNVSTRKLGSRVLADNVRIFRADSSGQLVPVALTDLNGITPSSQISYARTDWADKVDLVVVGGSNGRSTVYYGRAIFRGGLEGTSEGATYLYNELTVEYGNGLKVGPYQTGYQVSTGAFVAVEVSGGRITGLRELTELRSVPNTAWSGPGAVTVGGRTYSVADGVQCYDRASNSWIDLDAAHAYASTANLFVEGGIVRVLEIN